MDTILERVLRRTFLTGSLTVTTASGRVFKVGDGTGTPIGIRFASRKAQFLVLFDPDLKLGEAYTDGTLIVEEGTIADLLRLGLSQDNPATRPAWMTWLFALRYLYRRRQQTNGRARSKRNVAHHYDLDGRLYDMFLDDDRQYSCAYFGSNDLSLDEAQLAKKRHIAAKLLLQPEHRVLDIGCGWGGLCLYLADICGARATGITLSEEQLAISRARAHMGGLSGRADFSLVDYRDAIGSFDRIVSVGMFEHVGVGTYDAFFEQCARLLADDGVMLLHSIGRSDRPGITNPWIARYIFPGGYIPSLSEVLPAIERAGLIITDIEILRLHYAETLKHWRARFLERRFEATQLYDDRFVRLWEFYLAASEAAFREGGMMVFQIQLAKSNQAVPFTRDHVGQEEERLRSLDAAGQETMSCAAE